jgi:hypothetical protein
MRPPVRGFFPERHARKPTIDPREAKLVRQAMSSFIHAPSTRPAPIPIGEILPWAAFASILALLVLYFIGAEQGATSLITGHYLHEFVHDGRHIMAFPCH